jgi:MoaA/NifB/PqqE/SkfB family radical SAM enzyme
MRQADNHLPIGHPQKNFMIKEHTKGLKELSLEDYVKMLETFSYIEFCGQISDPIFHTKFHKLLEISKDIILDIHTAASQRPIKWYKKSFRIKPDATWIFGIDGLPEESHIYRVNQDGKYLFEVMKMAVSMGIKVEWQYIIFKYNQYHIQEAYDLAKKEHIKFVLIESTRHKESDNEKFTPTIQTTMPV